MEMASWLLPGFGAACALFALGSFVVRMPSVPAAVGTAALILAVVAWNALWVSYWSLGSAVLILIWMIYTFKRDELRAAGISSGKPLPRNAKWVFLFIVADVVAGIAHAYYTHLR